MVSQPAQYIVQPKQEALRIAATKFYSWPARARAQLTCNKYVIGDSLLDAHQDRQRQLRAKNTAVVGIGVVLKLAL